MRKEVIEKLRAQSAQPNGSRSNFFLPKIGRVIVFTLTVTASVIACFIIWPNISVVPLDDKNDDLLFRSFKVCNEGYFLTAYGVTTVDSPDVDITLANGNRVVIGGGFLIENSTNDSDTASYAGDLDPKKCASIVLSGIKLPKEFKGKVSRCLHVHAKYLSVVPREEIFGFSLRNSNEDNHDVNSTWVERPCKTYE